MLEKNKSDVEESKKMEIQVSQGAFTVKAPWVSVGIFLHVLDRYWYSLGDSTSGVSATYFSMTFSCLFHTFQIICTQLSVRRRPPIVFSQPVTDSSCCAMY